MVGRLQQLSKRDAKRFVNSPNGMAIDIQVKTPDMSQTFEITGWAVKHSISFDSDGNQVNTKIARVLVDEDVLVAKGITVRDSRGEINLDKYKFNFKDSSGILKGHSVREYFPDENLGLIMVLLWNAEL